MKQKEFILCAAIWVNDAQKHHAQPNNIDIGFVVAGRRHHNCYATITSIIGLNEAIKLKVDSAINSTEPSKNQGFITSLNRYVNREEAWKIAKTNNQIQFGLEASDYDDDELLEWLDIKEKPKSILISENLY